MVTQCYGTVRSAKNFGGLLWRLGETTISSKFSKADAGTDGSLIETFPEVPLPGRSLQCYSYFDGEMTSFRRKCHFIRVTTSLSLYTEGFSL